MKKVLLIIAAVAVTLGIGLSIPKETNQAGDPPIGSPVASGNTTLGDPPIG